MEDERLIMQREEIQKMIDELERVRGYLPYQKVIELKELKKRNLLLKDKLAGH